MPVHATARRHASQYGTARLRAHPTHSDAPHCRHVTTRSSLPFLGTKRCLHPQHTRVGAGESQANRTRFIALSLALAAPFARQDVHK